MTGIILLSPNHTEQAFHELKMDSERSVRFYCLVPLFDEEMKFKLHQGSEALARKFPNNQIDDVIDLNRKNVCKQSFFSKWIR